MHSEVEHRDDGRLVVPAAAHHCVVGVKARDWSADLVPSQKQSTCSLRGNARACVRSRAPCCCRRVARALCLRTHALSRRRTCASRRSVARLDARRRNDEYARSRGSCTRVAEESSTAVDDMRSNESACRKSESDDWESQRGDFDVECVRHTIVSGDGASWTCLAAASGGNATSKPGTTNAWTGIEACERGSRSSNTGSRHRGGARALDHAGFDHAESWTRVAVRERRLADGERRFVGSDL